MALRHLISTILLSNYLKLIFVKPYLIDDFVNHHIIVNESIYFILKIVKFKDLDHMKSVSGGEIRKWSFRIRDT